MIPEQRMNGQNPEKYRLGREISRAWEYRPRRCSDLASHSRVELLVDLTRDHIHRGGHHLGYLTRGPTT
jgi:hypothetical protein